MSVNRANRALAYHAIDTEREYQEKKWPDRKGLASRTVDDFISDIECYTAKLIGTRSSNTAKLDVMRKVAGLCVACFEMHGVPLRDGCKGTDESIVQVVRARAVSRAVDGYMTIPVTRNEYEALYATKRLDFILGEPGSQNIPTYCGLVVDRLDAIR